MSRTEGVLCALGAAMFWALATPISKLLLDEVAPLSLAGLCYLGAGVGLGAIRLVSGKGSEARLGRRDVPWLAGIVICGGVLAPICLLVGLQSTTAATASLLSCLEVVMAVLLAALLFREAVSGRVVLASLLMMAGGGVLAVQQGGWGTILSPGAVLVALGASLWALDGNLTRHLAHKDPIDLTIAKSLLAGPTTLGLAWLWGQKLPALSLLPGVLAMGFICYGASLVLYTRALRGLGAARTASIFALAPFLGAVASLPLVGEKATPRLLVAGGLMALGTAFLIREHHEHEHEHVPMEHDHLHVHDAHHAHRHEDAAGLPDAEAHSHVHRHEPLRHAHPHAPDVHHRHAH